MLEPALVARLSILAPNLYPLAAPKNYTTPCVVYNRLATTPVKDLSGRSDEAWVHEQIDIYDPSYLAAVTLAQQVREHLTSWSDDAVKAVIWDDEHHFSDQTTQVTLYKVVLRLIIMANLKS